MKNASLRTALAILLSGFVLLIPIGACASMSVGHASDRTSCHPCCPKAPAKQLCQTTGCVCIAAPEAVLTLPVLSEGCFSLAQTAIRTAPELNSHQVFAPPAIFHGPPDRYLSFHQILV